MNDIDEEVEQQTQDLTEIYEMLEEMTPPVVRLARQLLGEMHQLWEGLVRHEERILRIQDDLDEAYSVKNRLKVLEGALEETIRQVDELKSRRAKTVPAHEVRVKHRKKGAYCRNCAKPLTGRQQKIFCGKRCAAVWHGQHRGQFATPRFEINEKEEAVVEAGVGLVKGSV